MATDKANKGEGATAVAKRESVPMPVATIADLAQVGQAIAQSGMFGINNPAAGLVVAMTCHSQRISLLEFARMYHVIDGKPSMRADAMLAEFRKRGGKYAIVENSVTRAAADFEFEGVKYAGVYAIEDAQRSGDCFKADGKTLKHNWQHRAENMLWARMVSRSVRLLCPEIVAGIYTPEETEDFQGAENARPVQPISVSEAQSRQATQQTTAPQSASTPASAPLEPTDAELVEDTGACEIDPVTGNRFDEMDMDGLKLAWAHETLTDGHRAVIAKIVEMRKAGAQ